MSCVHYSDDCYTSSEIVASQFINPSSENELLSKRPNVAPIQTGHGLPPIVINFAIKKRIEADFPTSNTAFQNTNAPRHRSLSHWEFPRHDGCHRVLLLFSPVPSSQYFHGVLY